MQRKKILIVGGAGFIGSQVNKMLQGQGFETIIVDNLSTGSREAVQKGKLIVADMGEKEVFNTLFSNEKIDAVMHFAALIDVGESVTNPASYYENNVVKTLTLLNAMREHGVNHFIFSSSAAIFGIPEKIPLSEDHPKNPINPYGRTKLIVEEILNDFSCSYGLRFASLRYFNAAGGDPEGIIKNKKSKQSNLIPVSLKCIKHKTPLTIFGTDYPTKDGTCIRDYIHIYDLGQAHILALKKLFEGSNSAFYNLGNGKGYSVNEVVETVRKVTGAPLDVIIGKRRPGDPPELLADSTLAEKALGWKRQFPDLEAMVKDAWNAIN
jgi:UDP-glucose 4-epimerase